MFLLTTTRNSSQDTCSYQIPLLSEHTIPYRSQQKSVEHNYQAKTLGALRLEANLSQLNLSKTIYIYFLQKRNTHD